MLTPRVESSDVLKQAAVEVGSASLRLWEACVGATRMARWSFIPRSSEVNVRIIGDVVVAVQAWGDVARMAYVNQHRLPRRRSFEYRVFEEMVETIEPGWTILDIGANVGFHSLLASKVVGTDGNVIAFEPNPATAAILRGNLDRNECDNVAVVEAGAARGSALGFMERSSGVGDAFAHVRSSDDNLATADSVRLTSVDDEVERLGLSRVDFIKIDVEGGELPALEGSIETLKRFGPIVAFEAYEDYCKRFDSSVIQILSLLKDVGYEVRQADSYQWIATPGRDLV